LGYRGLKKVTSIIPRAFQLRMVGGVKKNRNKKGEEFKENRGFLFLRLKSQESATHFVLSKESRGNKENGH